MSLFDDQFIDDDLGTLEAAQTQDALVDTQQRLGMLLDLLPAGLFIHQMQGVLFANRKGCEMMGEDTETIVGKHLMDYVDHERREECMSSFMAALSADEVRRVEAVRIFPPDGDPRVVNIIMARLPWDGQTVIQALLEDVTLLKKREEELHRLTMTDALTGALNRRYFINQAALEVKRAIKQNIPYSIVTFDLDHFKNINDTYGHAAGDMVLKEIVTLWRKVRRCKNRGDKKPDGELARIGGEEFAILLPGSDIDAAKGLAERLRRTIEEHSFDYSGTVVPVTASFGGSQIIKGDKTIDDLMRRADEALYRSKANGRNQVTIA